MRVSVRPIPYLFLAGIATLLANCSGNSAVALQPANLGSLGGATHLDGRPINTNIAAGSPRAVRPDRHKSWISSDIKRATRLLFISDYGNSVVDVFSTPNLILKATITGFSGPRGMCSDNHGNVWVANTNTNQLIELSHSGTMINTIDDTYGYPVGCAVNPKNGDVAAFNIFNDSGRGGVYVYPCPSCTPTVLTIPNFYYYGLGAYDPKGNLYVTGSDSSGSTNLGEVRAGRTSGFVIDISGGTVNFAGLVGWYRPGNYLAVGDQLCGGSNAACVYWVSISGKTGTITGKTSLLNSAGGQICDLVQGAFDPDGQKNILGGDYEYCGHTATTVNRWLYPAGGIPTNSSTTTSPYFEPIGAAISTK